MSRFSDAVRLSAGTFSAVPVPAPRRVDRETAGIAVAIAPLAVLPVGVFVALVAWGARELGLEPVVVGALAIGAGAWATRGFHLDGLADTADALASSYDRDRALTVARTGDVGPAGAATLVLVLLVQAASAGFVAACWPWGPAAVGVLWCLARAGATVGLRRGVPAARQDGMGATFAGSVHPLVLVVVWLLVAAIAVATTGLTAAPMAHGLVTAVVTLVAVFAVVTHVVRRLGGIIGDAVGASVEIALVVLLVGFSAVVG
ncbi:adenosylcobinamide-GDP ribazoletransferase [Aeromicrobium senzhongii]|uniref:Adenosylcobinamide-GDP ribazoletransferase n=1 Tax=Aeromicrobium senzhongii TaxID=2663859 RepID=A0ABX6SV16_9ACTN|nr:adenosylcobinamide-GDP ribazoletransferase [Aeromicrobium senzhongii]MTB88588.1 adenosylcobinamide-GDP ribazoletransferase [Aeromicrobium senzhongii]QNL94100.1 adenosylcobinamide-GDP ribazoletransferase [Aeromicrobium senzhongii]